MAKRKKEYRQGKWEPKPSDAINLATIRWFALMMEAKAIEIYGTNPAVLSQDPGRPGQVPVGSG